MMFNQQRPRRQIVKLSGVEIIAALQTSDIKPVAALFAQACGFSKTRVKGRELQANDSRGSKLAVNLENGTWISYRRGQSGAATKGSVFDLAKMAGCAPFHLENAARRNLGLPERDGTAPTAKQRQEAKERLDNFQKQTKRREAHETRKAKQSAQNDLALYRSAKPSAGTVAQAYLERRAAWLPELSSVVRFAYVPHPFLKEVLPCILCVVSDVETREVRTVQRTFLMANGSDRIRRAEGAANDVGKMFGQGAAMPPGSVIDLQPLNQERGEKLHITEGLEQAAGLLARGHGPMMAATGAHWIASFPVLENVKKLVIWADHGTAGEAAANQLADRYKAAGRTAIVQLPPDNSADWGDLCQGAKK